MFYQRIELCIVNLKDISYVLKIVLDISVIFSQQLWATSVK